jgi:AmmeMemoRadiSam system protein B
MINVRRMVLPAGWYPHVGDGVNAFLKDYTLSDASRTRAVVSPHAGWFFSGAAMARAISSLQKNIDTIIVAGGHLGAGSDFLFAAEDAVQTPRGALFIDSELREHLQ